MALYIHHTSQIPHVNFIFKSRTVDDGIGMMANHVMFPLLFPLQDISHLNSDVMPTHYDDSVDAAGVIADTQRADDGTTPPADVDSNNSPTSLTIGQVIGPVIVASRLSIKTYYGDHHPSHRGHVTHDPTHHRMPLVHSSNTDLKTVAECTASSAEVTVPASRPSPTKITVPASHSRIEVTAPSSPSYTEVTATVSPMISDTKATASASHSHTKATAPPSPSHRKDTGPPSPSHKEDTGPPSPSHKEDTGQPSPSHTEEFHKAVKALKDTGRVVLCGPPGSGKSSLGQALLRHFKHQGYSTATLDRLCCQSVAELTRKGRSIVLIDGGLGEVGLDIDQHRRCRELLFNSRSRSCLCLLVFTAYLHVLQELKQLEAGSESPILEQATVVRLMRDPLNPTAALTPTVATFAPLLKRMVLDRVTGTSMAALLALSMLGQGHFLHDPLGVKSELQRLGFDGVSSCDLDRLACNLNGSILSDVDPGFTKRVLYDTAGLVLGQLGILPVVLKVCDAKFLVRYVRTSNTHAGSPNLICCIANDRRLLMQRMFELIEKGDLLELCQHPSFECPSFLKEFQDFCAKHKREKYMRRLVDAVDSQHGLPLLYWSLWSPSARLTLWCLKMTMKHTGNAKALTQNVLSAAFATSLYTQSVDSAKRKAKAFYEDLLSLKFRPTPESPLSLRLPQPCGRTPREKQDENKNSEPALKSGDRCYLGNPSLLIPAQLLSLALTEELALHMELASQHWYLLLRLLADREVDETDLDGNTALHVAVDIGDPEAIRLVLKSGASLAAKNRRGLTPYQLSERRLLGNRFCMRRRNGRNEAVAALHAACRSGDLETAQNSLCRSATVRDRGDNDDTPLHVACRAGQTRVASLLLQLGADTQALNRFKVTPLHAACHSGHLATAELLVQNGADVNIKAASRTPLHVATWKGHADLVAFLIQQRADVNAKGLMGYTPLHEACVHHHTAVARLLLQRNVSVNSRDGWGHSPLHYACRLSHVDLVELLLDHAADVHVKNERGWSPVEEAAAKGLDTVVALLQNHIASQTRGRRSL